MIAVGDRLGPLINFAPFSRAEFEEYKRQSKKNFPEGFKPEDVGYIPGLLNAWVAVGDEKKLK